MNAHSSESSGHATDGHATDGQATDGHATDGQATDGQASRQSSGDSSQGSITYWLNDLKASDGYDPRAGERLWRRCLSRLIGLAKSKLGSQPAAVLDEEQVALDAFSAFLCGIERRQFLQLDNRQDLWQILAMLVKRRAAAEFRKQAAQRRDFRRAATPPAANDPVPLEQLVAATPSPTAFALQIVESLEEGLKWLPGDEYQALAMGRLYGYSNQQLADQLGVSLATVENRFAKIRELWCRHLDDQ